MKTTFLATILLLLCWSATPPKTQTGPYFVEIITKFGVMKVRLYDETPLHRDNFIKLVKRGFYDSLTFHRISAGFTIQGGDYKSKYATADSVIGDGNLGYTIPAEIRPNIYHKKGALAAARGNSSDMASDASQFFIVQGKRYTVKEIIKIENYKNQRIKSDILYKITQSDTVKARMNDFTLRGDKDGMKKYVASFQSIVDTLYKQRGEYVYNTDQIQLYTSVGGLPQLDSGYTIFGEVISGLHIIDSINAQPAAKNERPLDDIRMKIRLVKK